MKIGIMGSGVVGQALASGFLRAGQSVKIGTRNVEKLSAWLAEAGKDASVGSFAEAAAFGEIVIIATLWDKGATEAAINLAGKENFTGKVVIDVTNPLVFETPGQPPHLALGYPASGGATIQQWLPTARVVKAFNIVTAHHMTNANLQEGTADLFIAGDDTAAKQLVSEIATHWGWQVQDMGGIEQSYLLEALAMLWIRYAFLNNHWTHAFKLLKK